MSAEFLYLGYVAGVWLGAIGATIGLARLVALRSPSFKVPLAIGAVGLVVAILLHPYAGPARPFGLPIAWWVAPVSGWGAVVSFALAIGNLARILVEIEPSRKLIRGRSIALWTVCGSICLFLWRIDGFESRWMRGVFPLSAGTAIVLGLLFIVALALMAQSAKSTRFADKARGWATHVALIAGSLIFGLPFFWLLLTSFKEDRDMASPDGIVWTPRVTEMVPYLDPDDPIVEARFQGQSVQGSIVRKNADGSALIDIFKPGSMRGMTFTAPAPLRIVPKDVQVVSFRVGDANLAGKTIKDLGDGGKVVEVIRPPDRRGERHELSAAEFELVRPIGLRTQNYSDALDFLPPETHKGLVYLKNSFLLAALTVLGTLLSSSLVAYAFARLRFPNKDALFGILLATMALPAAVTMLPTFLIYRWLGWIDTLTPLWAPAFLGSAFNIFLLRQFFATIPLELEDAAKIDGCGYLGTYWRVMSPQIKPALAFVAVTTAMQAWNNFMGPLVYINSPEKMPIAYAVQLFQGDRSTEPGLLMAFATMGMAPILILFFFTQKYFVENVALSGLGGR